MGRRTYWRIFDYTIQINKKAWDALSEETISDFKWECSSNRILEGINASISWWPVENDDQTVHGQIQTLTKAEGRATVRLLERRLRRILNVDDEAVFFTLIVEKEGPEAK